MKLTPITCLIASGAFLACNGAWAADRETILSHVNAPVMVNQGDAYVEAQEGMQLYPGDQLMIMAGGSAQIEYMDGCLQELNSNDVYRIGPQSACNSVANASVNHQIQPGGTTAGSGGTGGSSTMGLVAAAVVGVGAGVVIIDQATDDNDKDDRPDISP